LSNEAHHDRKAAHEHRQALAFNSGCDACLLGVSSGANPYADDVLSQFWDEGWDHVNSCWGADVRHRWAYLLLRAYSSRGLLWDVGKSRKVVL
jgi:hypothetical protein